MLYMKNTKTKLKRILIVGDACRGKSTLASKISKKLGIPNYSTDDFFYEIKFTKRRDKEESIRDILKIYEKEEWVVEGTTKHLVEHGLDSADKIIYLRHKKIFIQWLLLLKRHFQRDGDTLSDLFGFMKHVLYKKYKLGHRKGRATPSEIIKPYQHKVVTLSSFKEIETFLNSL